MKHLKYPLAAAFAALVGASLGAVKLENAHVRWEIGDDTSVSTMVDYDKVHQRVAPFRIDSFNFLKNSLDGINL